MSEPSHTAFTVQFAALTDTGRVREHNEDCVGVMPEYGLAVLADGMGGHNGGEVASDIAVRVVQNVVSRRLSRQAIGTDTAAGISPHELLSRAFQEANVSILNAVAYRPELQGMGTTLVALLIDGQRVTIAHVGDSRAYRIRQHQITRLTKDHSLLQQEIDAGAVTEEEARTSNIRNLLTRAIGTHPGPEVDVEEHDVEANDMYLLCSDGLTDMLSDGRIQEIVESGENLPSLTQQLTNQANHEGGRDNVSVVLVTVDAGDDIPQLGEIID